MRNMITKYKAKCECGWVSGKERHLRENAEHDGDDHTIAAVGH